MSYREVVVTYIISSLIMALVKKYFAFIIVILTMFVHGWDGLIHPLCFNKGHFMSLPLHFGDKVPPFQV